MSIQYRLLIVDDDEPFRSELAEQLALSEGFTIDQAGSCEQARSHLHNHYDAMVIDVGLPDGDGRAFCRDLRAGGVKSPIIMLTGHDTDNDMIAGLDSGANDYVTKPVRLGVLMARLRAQLRQFELSDDASFEIGPYSFKPAAKMLLFGNKRIHLTEKETAILKYLYRAGDRPVKRETLLGEVWGYNAGVTTHTLETHVYRLRQKIEPVPGSVTLLVTEPEGYRLVRATRETSNA